MSVKKITEEFIELNGFCLYTKRYEKSTDGPTVVFDAGYGDCSKSWNSIAPEVASMTNVIVYDRAGVGKSDSSPNPRTSEYIVKELHQLLRNSNANPPYILVGHSFGGVNIRLYTTMFPEEVAAIVLIDSTPEDYKERFLPTMDKNFQRAYNKQFVHEATYDEFMESLDQLTKNRRHLGNRSLIVLSAGKKSHYSKHSQELWHNMQRETVNLSNQSELIIAHNSSHYIQNDEPELLINAIKKVLRKHTY
ncbi:alpha/beta fold hydrolase [Alteribacter populi]|uniref:alpha/beta fold hydrolase n=1 Tax=Alteribacter populi TaxID=2011011 RepID=UPI000BBB334C|nr:alpha/beta hydrolase [Alteribacter populi]